MATAPVGRTPKLLRGKKSQRTVRTDGVVVDAPSFDRAASVGDIDEPVLVQTGVPKLAVEAFYQRVLDRLARLNEAQGRTNSLRPEMHRLAGELGPVVGDDGFGDRTFQHDLIQESADTLAGDRGVHDLADVLPAVVVHNVQHSEPAARDQLIRDAVHRPTLVRPFRNRHRHSIPRQKAFPSFPPDLEFLFAVDSIRLLLVHNQTLGFQHPVQQLVSVARIFGCLLLQTFPEFTVVSSLRLMAGHRSVDSHHQAGPPLTQHPDPDQLAHGSAACSGPYQFFESSSFSAALSSCALE